MLKINNEFKDLIPPLTADEYTALEESILIEGCRDAILVWNETIVDGHNRFEICSKYGIEFSTREINFESILDAKVWIRKNQLSRRNLSDAWKLELQFANKADLLEIGRERLKTNIGGDHMGLSIMDKAINESPDVSNMDRSMGLSINDKPFIEPHNTRKEIAKAVGVASGTVARAEVVRNTSPELWEKAKAGEITIGGAYDEIKKAERKEERKETALSDGLSKQFIYDVWNIGYISNKIRHPGNIPQEFIENLLYLHTEENDLVYDPFGGGGPTIDMCNKWHRNYYVSDLAPIPERPEIKKWNLEDGLPDDLVNPKLTFLDPPYYKKMEDSYVKESISSMDKEEYLIFFKYLAENLFARHENNTCVAFIMSNYIDYTNYKNSIWVYDYVKLFENAGFTIHTWIQCPLSTQQYSAWDVNRAKENKELLAISRDLVVFVKEGNNE